MMDAAAGIPVEWVDAEGPLTLEDRRALLASPVGRGLHPRDLAVMLGEGYARLATASAGSILALAAERQQEFFVVLAGSLEVAQDRADGSRVVLDVIAAPGACGAVTAFAERPRWPAAVHVTADARLLALALRPLMADLPPNVTTQRLLQNCLLLVAGRARHLRARGELLVRRGLRERLAFFLVRNADADGHVALAQTRASLAEHLNVSRASMTRELGRMADEGLIRMRGRSFLLLDAAALRQLAD